MPTNYEDNYGFYNVWNDPDELAFFHNVKMVSVPKACVRCHQNVYLQPYRKMCAMCSEALENGAPSGLDLY